MNMRIALFIVVAALAGSAAQADDNMYAEVGVVPMKFSVGGGSVTPTVAVARWGYDFTKNLGAEVTLATTLKGVTRNGETFKVDNAVGAYLKARTGVDAGGNVELFAKVGVVRTQLSVSDYGSASDNSFSYAAGLQYHFSKRFYGQIDYASYYSKDGLNATGPSLSFGVSF